MTFNEQDTLQTELDKLAADPDLDVDLAAAVASLRRLLAAEPDPEQVLAGVLENLDRWE